MAPNNARKVQPRLQAGALCEDAASPLLAPADETSHLLDPTSNRVPSSDDGSLWYEFALLCQYSIPSIATYLLQYSFTIITTVVAGHLGPRELGAASVGLSTLAIVGMAFLEGMATALDTLCAQAYGAGHLTSVGLHVQRMTLFMSALLVPIGAFCLCSPRILPLILQDRELAVEAGRFLQISLIGLPGYAYFEAGKRFLQAQGDFKAGMVVLIICTPLNALLSWFFAFRLDMGLDGAALGQAIANNLRPVLLLIHTTLFSKWSLECWTPWSFRTLHGWGPMVRLSIASSAVNLGEWIAFEALAISTSYIDTEHLAAQAVLSTLCITLWHIPFSISIAVSTRIGHLIGSGLPSVARRAAGFYGIIFTGVGVLDAAVLFIFRHQLSAIFSEDSTVQAIAEDAMLILAVFQIIDAVNSGLNGILRGLGLQSVAAWIVLVVNYIAALPLSVWLELGSPAMKLKGLWAGMGCGMVLIAIIEAFYMWYINWDDCCQAEEDREREAEHIEEV